MAGEVRNSEPCVFVHELHYQLEQGLSLIEPVVILTTIEREGAIGF